jgi:hypothetical protein
VTLLARFRRAVSGRDEANVEKRLKEISDRLAHLEDSLAGLEPNIKMLPGIVRKLYLDGAELPHPYDLLSERFHYRSQNEEDGLLLALFKRIGMTDRRCVEIGCGLNGGNSGFLVQECGWSGLMVDADRHKIDTIKERFAGHAVVASKHRITVENINDVLQVHGFTGEIDFLSLDIDGNDYWIWEALTACSPRVVAIEYNWLFGPERAVTIPYDPLFRLSESATRAYRGASLAALTQLSQHKGYRLVASERVNAFFLRNDVAPDIPAIDVTRGYRAPKAAHVEDVFTKIQQAGLSLVEVEAAGDVAVRVLVETER